MNNLLTTVFAVLARANLITREAAKTLAEETQSIIHQSKYEDAEKVIERIEAKIKVLVSEPWLKHISVLEDKVKSLETQIEKLAQTKKK